jgi:hypothetical protein
MNARLSRRNRPLGLNLGVLAALLLGRVSAQQISWSVPDDGGTPRDTNRIERVGPLEFRIRASFEEGGPSVLRHAVSRVDLLCRNAGAQAAPVTVHLDLSGDGKRTDYDTKPEAGMKLRDFLFIQPPGQSWQQIDGSTERWVLPNHPHLEKRLVGKSDDGREHWELTITDPAVPAERKRKISWQAREHAYETYSSFAMEGMKKYGTRVGGRVRQRLSLDHRQRIRDTSRRPVSPRLPRRRGLGEGRGALYQDERHSSTSGHRASRHLGQPPW